MGAEKKTLQSAIAGLELERKKITAEIQKTENLISSTDLEINKLLLETRRTNTAEAIYELLLSERRSDREQILKELSD